MSQRQFSLSEQSKDYTKICSHVVRIGVDFATNQEQCNQLANWLRYYQKVIELTNKYYEQNDTLRTAILNLIEDEIANKRLPNRYLKYFERTSIEKYKRQALSVDSDFASFLIPSGSGFQVSISRAPEFQFSGLLSREGERPRKNGSSHVKLKVLSGITGYTDRHHIDDCMSFQAIKYQKFYQYFLLSPYCNTYGLRIKFSLETRFDLDTVIQGCESDCYEDRRRAVNRLTFTLPYRCYLTEDLALQMNHESVKGLIQALKPIPTAQALYDSFSQNDKDLFRLLVVSKVALKHTRKEKIKEIVAIFRTGKKLAISNQVVTLSERQCDMINKFIDKDDDVSVSLADYVVGLLPALNGSPGNFFVSIQRMIQRMGRDLDRLDDQMLDLQKFISHDGVLEEIDLLQDKYNYIHLLRKEFSETFQKGESNDKKVVQINSGGVSTQRDVQDSRNTISSFG